MTDMLVSPAPSAAPARPQNHAHYWVNEVDGYLTCTEIVDVTHDVKTFSFELSGPASLHFLPGQFLTFRFLINGERVERCYTISSAPTRPERLTITVKRVPGGVVSNWLHDHFRVGDAIDASGPFGQFSSAIHPAAKYLFVTAGSGITPAMSMLRTLCDSGEGANAVFRGSGRHRADDLRAPAGLVLDPVLEPGTMSTAARTRTGCVTRCE